MVRARTRPAAAAVVYLILVGTLLTDLYLPFERKEGDEFLWFFVSLVAGASVAVGAAVGRPWVLLLPTAFCVALFAANRESDGIVAVLMIVLPALLALTLIGLALSRVKRLARPVAAVGLAIALVPVALGAFETSSRALGPELSRADQARLPIRQSLQSLCVETSRSARDARRLRRQGEQLAREVRARPNYYVDSVYYRGELDDAVPVRVTVRELAQQELEALGEYGRGCAPRVRGALKAALAA